MQCLQNGKRGRRHVVGQSPLIIYVTFLPVQHMIINWNVFCCWNYCSL